METKDLKNILVVALDNLGDAVMATSVFKPLKKLAPQASIGFWVKEYAADLFRDQSLIDVVHASDPFWDKAPGQNKGQIWKFRRVLGEIKHRKYDVAIVLNAEWRRSAACRWIGVPTRIGYRRKKSGPFLTQAYPAAPALQHFVDDHRQLLEIWTGQGVALDDAIPRLEGTPLETSWWQDWAKARGLADKSYIVIHLFSGDEDKNWPLSCWVELLETRLKRNDSERFVLVCGPGEEPKLSPYKHRLDRSEIVFLIRPRLLELKAVIAHARAVLGGDSGLGHVAAAMGTPVLSLFGITHPERSRPMGHGRVHVLQQDPLRRLPVEAVLKTMDNFL